MEKRSGFTLIELLIVIAIVAILSTVTLVSLNIPQRFREAKITQAVGDASALKTATQLYFKDIGFYPPDVNRGADPGFTQVLPYFPDGHEGELGIEDSHLPPNWQDIASQNWKGPYLGNWPMETPWEGKYDYNYWAVQKTRSGDCVVEAGVYVGVQGDYNNQNTIPQEVEEEMANLGYDADGCVNGEAQLLLIKF